MFKIRANIIWGLFFISFILFKTEAQVKAQDSLRLIWKNNQQPDSVRFNAIDKYVKSLPQNQTDSISFFAQKQYNLSINLGPKQRIKALNNLALGSRKNFELRLNYLLEALEAAQLSGDKNLIFTSQVKLTKVYDKNKYNIKKARYHGEQAIKIANELNNVSLQLEAHSLMGIVDMSLVDKTSALEHFNSAILLADSLNNKRELIRNKINRAGLYSSRGEYEKSIREYEACLIDNEALNDKKARAIIYNNIGHKYSLLEKYDKAIYYKKHGFYILDSLGETYMAALDAARLGRIYIYNKDHKNAAKYFEKGIELMADLDEHDQEIVLMYSSSGLGDICRAKKNYKNAEQHYIKGIELSRKYNYKFTLAECLFKQGGAYIEQGKSGLAKERLQEALEIAKSRDYKRLIDPISKQLSKIYAQNGNYKQALDLYKYHITVRDSLKKMAIKEALIAQEYNYNYIKKQYQDSVAYAKKETIANIRHQTSLNRERFKLKLLIIFVVVLGIFTFMIFNTYRVHQRTNLKLEELNFKLKLFNNVVAHDLKTPIISFKAILQKVIDKYGDTITDKDSYLLKLTEKRIDNLNKMISDLLLFYSLSEQVKQLDTSVVDFKNLVHTVKSELETNYNTKIDMKISTLPTLELNKNLMYQLFTNLMTNAVKYAKPDIPVTLKISAKKNKGVYEFCIADNGVGIADDFKKIAFDLFSRVNISEKIGHGLGLPICKNIVDHYKGTIWIEDNSNQGSSFYFTLPV